MHWGNKVYVKSEFPYIRRVIRQYRVQKGNTDGQKSPMTKVAANNKECVLIRPILRQSFVHSCRSTGTRMPYK